MISLPAMIAFIYWCIDGWTLTKYVDQIRTILRTQKVIGSSRKYFLKAIIRELAFVVYCLVYIGLNWVLLSLALLSLIFNVWIFCLMIRYKRVYRKKNWEDKIYDWIKVKIIKEYI